MTGVLVLPEDIQLVPVADFPADVRAQIGGDDHDYAVTRPRSRAPSKVINAQAAELLREFRTPTTLVEAILRLSKSTRRDPAQVVEEVYPFLESCLIAKLLVEPGADSHTIRPSFDDGSVVPDILPNCRVDGCIQVLNDTELYRVRSGDLEAALKIARLRSGPLVIQSIERESRILRLLNGRITPRILSSGKTEDGRSYLVMEWIRGELCGEAAAALRAGANEPLPVPLLLLCAEVLDAYAILHSLGVIHSDVHANNVLALENGEVRIIDLGLSRCDTDKNGDVLEPASVLRAGVGFFIEPEYARAMLSDSAPPLSSRAGEQYSVAALIYFLLSGHHYLDFSYGQQEIHHQIAGLPPLPLSAWGIPGASMLDDVLFRALSKDPSARFPDMASMASAFRNAVRRSHLPLRTSQPSAALAANRYVDQRSSDDRQRRGWLESTLNSLSDSTFDLTAFGLSFPTASLAFGAAGIAYGLFCIACVREDAQLFALAERWLDRADREIGEAGSYHRDVQITPETVGHISPHYTSSGVACVQALLAHSGGDLRTRAIAIERFLKFSDRACKSPDLTVGKSGTLLALSLLLDAFRWDRIAGEERLIEVGNDLLGDLWRDFDSMPAIGDPKFSTRLGVAHGWAGYLYATLRWIRSTQAPVPGNVQARLQQLANIAHREEARVFWPRETNPGSPVFGGWCEGSAGFVFLWTLAHCLLRDPQWLSLAEGAGHDACLARDEGSSLCCGLAGKAYSQLNLYKHTGNRCWLDNASAIASLATRKAENMIQTVGPQLPHSLYKGDLALAVLIAELEHPTSAAMPFFEDQAWPTALRGAD